MLSNQYCPILMHSSSPILWSVPDASVRPSHKNKTKTGELMKSAWFTFITRGQESSAVSKVE